MDMQLVGELLGWFFGTMTVRLALGMLTAAWAARVALECHDAEVDGRKGRLS